MATTTVETATASGNREKLQELLVDVFLLEDQEFSFELSQEDIETWDSLSIVSMAVGVHETFGYHMTPEEATSISSVPALISLLEQKGLSFAA